MGATTLTHVTTINPNNTNIHGPVVDEVEGVIKVYKDGHVERSQLVPCVDPSIVLELDVACSDVHIDKLNNVWARLYVPKTTKSSVSKLPLLVYFHGGGFCVGSASWSCYHEFLARLSARSRCLIMSVNYRLAPENPLPAAYEDGINALLWLSKTRNDNFWAKLCDFNRIFLVGDSAGGNIAHQVAARLADADMAVLNSLNIEGTVLIQPFFGGEARTESERRVVGNHKSSVLTLAASDAYWRLALPRGANRDHPYCKPVNKSVVRTLVCVSEMDVLMDREMEMMCGDETVMKRVVYGGVGHAFQILGKSQRAHTRTLEMLSHIDAFIHNCDSFC